MRVLRHFAPRRRVLLSTGPCTERTGAQRRASTSLTAIPWSPRGLPVTEKDIQDYRRDGVVKIRHAFGSEWVSFMRDAFQEGMEKPGPYAEFIRSRSNSDTHVQGEDGGLDMFQDQVFFHETIDRLPRWAAVVEHSQAAGMIAKLMGSRAVSFFYIHPIMKCGGSQQTIPWHQDLPYWKVDGKMIGSVWVALDDMPLASSVRYLRGSHRWGLFRPRHFADNTPYEGRDELSDMPDIEHLLEVGSTEVLAFEVKAGDALCFDARIVHGSSGNAQADGAHRRIALRFCGEDVVYCDRAGETAIPTPEVEARHGLRDGDPLSSAMFPLVWPRDS